MASTGRLPGAWHNCGGVREAADRAARLDMLLSWAIIFAVVALIAGVFGFGGAAAAAGGVARILFFIFVLVSVVMLIAAIVLE